MEKKHKKEKSEKQLLTKEVAYSDKLVIKAVLVGAERMDARAYRAVFKRQQKKANMEGHCEEMKNKNSNGNVGRDGASADADGGGECSEREVEELIDMCIFRDSEENLEGNSIVSEPVKETLEDKVGPRSPHKCQKLRGSPSI